MTQQADPGLTSSRQSTATSTARKPRMRLMLRQQGKVVIVTRDFWFD
jgi:hypothetical protein